MNLIFNHIPEIGIAIETILRLFPSKKNYSPIHNILKVLLAISSGLNRESKSANDKAGLIVIVFLSVALLSCRASRITPACKHTILIPTTFQTDSNSFYTVDVPYCDSITFNKKPKKNE